MSEPQPATPIESAAEPAPLPAIPFWGYADLALFAAAAAPSLLVGALLAQALMLAFPEWSGRKALLVLPAQFFAYGVWFVFLLVLLRAKYRAPFWRSLGWGRPAEPFWFWRQARTGILVACGIVLGGLLLRTPDIDMPMKQLLSDRVSLIAVGLAAVSLGPVCEELAFRGFLLPLLVRSWGAAPGILLAAMPFAILHGPQYAWSWRHIVLILAAGAAFGWIRHRTGSTAASAVAHAFYNFTFLLLYALQERNLPARW
ncbi:MAG: CPBP family intramembrane glutamic endopeptidase [Bryobacterales bacterium]|nr:CPBP family intramembrane metalloprotease [Bryobacteraceae bacterium]MDW8354721.1 CPBP family intramembrane glutamic endopeptidase [Bryobacterales bacterium]